MDDGRRFTIPATLDGVLEQLSIEGRLAIAKQWDKAALVYAITRDGTRGPGANPTETYRNISFLSAEDLAGKGIVGLRTPHTVIIYRQAWAWAIKQGWADPVEPGASTRMPDTFWPEGSVWPDTLPNGDPHPKAGQLIEEFYPATHRNGRPHPKAGQPMKVETWPPTRQGGDFDTKSQEKAGAEANAEVIATLLKREGVKEAAADILVETVAGDAKLIGRASSRYLEQREPPRREKPGRAVLAFFGLAATLLERVRKERQDIAALVQWLQQRQGRLTPMHEQSVQSSLRDLRRAANLLHRYADDIQAASGVEPVLDEETWIDGIERAATRGTPTAS